MSISNTHEYVELIHRDRGTKVIVQEFTDFYFDYGWRFNRYVPNHEVDYWDIADREDQLSNWLLKNSASDPYKYNRVPYETSGTSEQYFYEEPEIY